MRRLHEESFTLLQATGGFPSFLRPICLLDERCAAPKSPAATFGGGIIRANKGKNCMPGDLMEKNSRCVFKCADGYTSANNRRYGLSICGALELNQFSSPMTKTANDEEHLVCRENVCPGSATHPDFNCDEVTGAACKRDGMKCARGCDGNWLLGWDRSCTTGAACRKRAASPNTEWWSPESNRLSAMCRFSKKLKHGQVCQLRCGKGYVDQGGLVVASAKPGAVQPGLCFNGDHTETPAPVCKEAVCPCSNGPVITGAKCGMDGLFCRAGCATGWRRDWRTKDCTIPKCTCAHGAPKQGCTAEDREFCRSCKPGFRRYPAQPNVCVAKLPPCMCANGRAARSFVCAGKANVKVGRRCEVLMGRVVRFVVWWKNLKMSPHFSHIVGVPVDPGFGDVQLTGFS